MFSNSFSITPEKSEPAINIMGSIHFNLNLIYQAEHWILFFPYSCQKTTYLSLKMQNINIETYRYV
jgi:hypothetical protein